MEQNTDQILDAPPVSEQKLEYAGFWIRVGASLIDSVILGVANALIGLIFPEVVSLLVSIGVGVIYSCGLESSEHQATLGKMAVGIRVGDANGEQISFLNALGRHLAKILSFITLCIGYMMVGWDDKKQGLHDKLAETYVYHV